MGKDAKKVPFLSDLGRANMRGLRKCKKCGTLNGTRGFSCKNVSCDVIFKTDISSKKSFNDASKLDSGNCRQIYSVRVRDKGPDYRSFVELSNGIDGQLLLQTPNDILLDDGAKCYIDMCVKNAKYAVGEKSICNHIRAAQQCFKEARTLVLRNTSAHLIQIPSAMKNELWQLATESPGPLVQRVSKAVMVVKCRADTQHPLGFLNLSFHQYFRNRKDSIPKFFCSCRYFKDALSHKFAQLKYCIHFYACIMAFASNDALTDEFSYFINLVKSINNNFSPPEKPNISYVRALSLDDDTKEVSEVHLNENDDSFLILNNNGPGSPCRVEVEVLGDISEDSLMLPLTANEDIESKLEIQLHTDDPLQLRTSECGRVSVHQLPHNVTLSNLKGDEANMITKRINLFPSKRPNKDLRRSLTRNKKPSENEDELTTFTFSSWISSVAERINQTMQYGFSGKPDPIVFHIPKKFFNCILNRINKFAYTCGKRKKCFVEKTSFSITDAVPCGRFTKLTWKLTNLNHVVDVFSSSERRLKTEMYFIADKNGKYKVCDPPTASKLDVEMNQDPAVRAHELKTVLNVGFISSALSKEPVPFIVEWIPDIIPQSEIGELRLKFEFIHFNNSHYYVAKTGVSSSTVKNRQILPLAPKIPLNKLALPLNVASDIQVPHQLVPGDIAILTF